MNRILSLFAFLVLVGYLSILVWRVPRIDLATVIAITLLLALWDIYSSARRGRSRG